MGLYLSGASCQRNFVTVIIQLKLFFFLGKEEIGIEEYSFSQSTLEQVLSLFIL